jgi:hypothetical protein
MSTRITSSISYLVVLPLAILLVFSPAIGTFFAQDDFSFLTRAQQEMTIRLLRNFTHFDSEFYRPLLEVYFAVLIRYFGVDPAAFHIAALIILSINAMLVVQLAKALGLDDEAAVVAGFFYGCHPALLTAVMWAAAANTLLATFWSLVTLWIVTRGRTLRTCIPATLTLTLALSAREVAAIVPALAWLACWLPHRPWRQRWRDVLASSLSALTATAPLWMLLLGYMAVRRAGLARLAAGPAYAVTLTPGTLLNNIQLLATHATGLSTGMQQWIGQLLFTSYPVLFWVVLVPGSVLLFIMGKPTGFFGLLWFFLGIIPVISLARHNMDPYYLDLALIGLALSVGALVHALAQVRPKYTLIQWAHATLLILWLFMSMFSVRVELLRSPVLGQALQAQAMLIGIKALYPTLPRGATMYISGTDERTDWAIGFGDMYRVAYRDLSLKVLLENRGDPLPLDYQSNPSFFAFEMRENRLRDVTTAMRKMNDHTAPSPHQELRTEPVLLRLHPSRTRSDQIFNIQPNGQAALAVDTENATPDTIIIFGNVPLTTTYGGPTLLTAIVPRELYAQPGRYTVHLRNRAGESNRLEFIVEP